VTESQPRPSAAVARTGKRTPAKAKSTPKTLPTSLKAEPTHRHPNLGLAPVDMTSGFANAAERLRRDRIGVAGRALVAATKSDPTIGERYDEVGLRRLLHDSEVLTERLAMCLASDDSRWLAGFAEWIAPIYRRRGVTLLDLATLCDAIGDVIGPDLTDDERASASRALDAATLVLKRNSRIAGDRHKRNALWKWMYRGV
jgi:hypothetical protein